ncbi:DUF4186 family protein [Chitinophaga sp. GbtcB8]|uniref:DUF4186 family protein n=1 Tax=Chitinophaga sp. GbtcB8 TaxID=2824753 RepID=UPI001C2F57BF|nr:DUF4186 family protein [Chitinophaga sp. GbtcB8]
MKERKKFKRVVPEEIKITDLTVLDITCGTTKCSEGFHCYSQKKSSIRKFGKERVCKECGADLIDWERIHKGGLKEVDFIFESLQSEIIRHVFWHTPIQEDALEKTFANGYDTTKAIALKLLKARIGKYNYFMDGRQTPMGKDEIVNYAQHATATCCRKCLETWHNINMEVPLTEEQLEYCAELVMKYIARRIPGLTKEGITDEEQVKKLAREFN